MQSMNIEKPAFPFIGFSTKWLTRKVIYIWETILNVWRKHQTFRETTFAKRGNAKPFGKQLSPSAEITNLSGNDFRQARKCQTIRETTFAKRGNAKLFKKWFAGAPQAPNPLKSDLREVRKQQILKKVSRGRPYRRARNDRNYNRNTLVDNV